MQVGPGKSPAGVAGAVGVQGLGTFLVAGVLDIDPAPGGEQAAMARLPGGQHAVEEVDALLDAEEQILRCTHAHEIPGAIGRQGADELCQGGVHLFLWLAHAQAPHGEALEGRLGIQVEDLLEVALAQIQMGTALVDGEEPLVFRQGKVPGAFEPAGGAGHGGLELRTLQSPRRAFVQGHDDI